MMMMMISDSAPYMHLSTAVNGSLNLTHMTHVTHDP